MAHTDDIAGPTRIDAFEDAYDAHIWDVYAFIAYRVRVVADVEDLTQQTFEKGLRAWSRFDPERASAKTWLIAIARNVVIDHFRSSRDVKALDEEAEGSLASSDTLVEEQARFGVEPALAAALASLSARDREVVALRFGGDLKGTEIAEELGLSLANVQQILSRSLRQLKALLTVSEEGSKSPSAAAAAARSTDS